MSVFGRGAAELVLCAAAGLLAHCSSASNTSTDAGAPDSSKGADVSVDDGNGDAVTPIDEAEAGVGALDSGEEVDEGLDSAPVADSSVLDATDAIDAVDAADAGPVEHVVPDGIYDCDMVQVRCSTYALVRLATADGGLLFSFEMTVAGNTVVIPPNYACTGSWYAAGTAVDPLSTGGRRPLAGGFACLLQGLNTCAGYVPTDTAYLDVLPNDPEGTLRLNADGGALQPGEIYVGLDTSNTYNAHCAPRH